MSKYNEKIVNLQKENKQLRKALETKHYCKYANRCNELYDCTREEYNSMAERNIKLSLENDELQQENKQLKKCYCNRTDCIGRIKDSRKYDSVKQQLDKATSILTELEEWFKKEKQIAEENIIESKKWLEIEEEKEHAKSDIHTGKIIRRYMQYGLNKIQELKEKYK